MFLFFGKICSKLYFYRVNLETSCSGTAEESQCRLSFKDRRIYFLTTYVSEAVCSGDRIGLPAPLKLTNRLIVRSRFFNLHKTRRTKTTLSRFTQDYVLDSFLYGTRASNLPFHLTEIVSCRLNSHIALFFFLSSVHAHYLYPFSHHTDIFGFMCPDLDASICEILAVTASQWQR